jgi:hypothetical protein
LAPSFIPLYIYISLSLSLSQYWNHDSAIILSGYPQWFIDDFADKMAHYSKRKKWWFTAKKCENFPVRDRSNNQRVILPIYIICIYSYGLIHPIFIPFNVGKTMS